MLNLFFGIIIFYFCLSNLTIEQSKNDSVPYQNVFQKNAIIIQPIMSATPIKNENWNEYIVLNGNNFRNKPLRIKKKNFRKINS
jgi:hypothetical protein